MPVSSADYTALITPFFKSSPKFVATVAVVAEFFAEQQNFLRSVPEAYCLDHAIGVQLDVVGQWIGRSRYLPVPLPNIYFSFDEDRLGFDQAIWYQPYAPVEETVALDDDTYRKLLYMKVAANNWDGSITSIGNALAIVFPITPSGTDYAGITVYGAIATTNGTPFWNGGVFCKSAGTPIIQSLLTTQLLALPSTNLGDGTPFWNGNVLCREAGTPISPNDLVVNLLKYGTDDPGDGTPYWNGGVLCRNAELTANTYVFVQDNLDMSITVAVSGIIPTNYLLAILSPEVFPFEPMATKVYYECTSVNGSPCFGFDVDNNYVGGLDSGAWERPIQETLLQL